jgi:hypothetical protein
VSRSLGIDSLDKRAQREQWLDPPMGQYKVPEEADQWLKTGRSLQLEAVDVKAKIKLD